MTRIAALLALIAAIVALGVATTGHRGPGTVKRSQIGNRSALETLMLLGRLSARADPTVFDDHTSGRDVGLLDYSPGSDRTSTAMPSTTLARDTLGAEFAFDAVSLAIDPTDWSDPDIGINANPYERGKRWERGACLSLFEAGRLVTETRVGIRIHGDTSRGRVEKSLRVVLSSAYGSSVNAADLLPGALGESLVLHNDARRSRFVNPIAYEIAHLLGCTVPRTRPVRVLLNGVLQRNVYFLSEHLSRSYVRERLGHDHFVFLKERWDNNNPKPKNYRSRYLWTMNHAPALMRDAGQHVDIDNVIDWITAVLFCAPFDSRQGIAYLDQRGDTRWRWVMWDMDWSFLPWPKTMHGRPLTTNNITDDLLQPKGDLRTALFSHLMADDPAFRHRLLARASKALNHELASNRLGAILYHYREVARVYGEQESARILSAIDNIEAGQRERPARLRAELVEAFGIGPIHVCTVRVPPGRAVSIDGHPAIGDYTGHYFAGQTVTVTIEGSPCEWRVNGRTQGANTAIELPVDRDLRIEAIAR